MTVGINTEAINNKNIPFTMYDLGWVVLCIGAAIGSGIVFFPLQVGLGGWCYRIGSKEGLSTSSKPQIYIQVLSRSCLPTTI